MTISTLGIVHVTAAFAALALGLFVLLNAKGTLAHRVMGAGYVAAMVIVNFSSFGVLKLMGGYPGPFHILAALSLISVIRGILPLIQRRTGWLLVHYRAMSVSYIGLLSAATAEAMIRIPATRMLIGDARTGVIVSLIIIVTYAIGGRLAMHRLERRVLARFTV